MGHDSWPATPAASPLLPLTVDDERAGHIRKHERQ